MSLNTVRSVYKSRFKVCDSVVTTEGITIPCITGQVGQVDLVSQNGYRYKTDFWEKVLSDPATKSAIDNREMLGTIEHPDDDEAYLRTPYEQASHVVISAWIDNHNPFATLGLLNNDKGNAIKALIDIGHKPGVSTRGLGSIEQDSVSQFVSDEAYILLGWDLVRNPNFDKLCMEPVSDSITKSPLFKELCEQHKLQDSSYQGYNHNSLKQDMAKVVDELKTLSAHVYELAEKIR